MDLKAMSDSKKSHCASRIEKSRLDNSKKLSVLPAYTVSSRKPTLSKKAISKKLSPSPYASKSLSPPIVPPSTGDKKLSEKDKPLPVKKYITKGLKESPIYTPNSGKICLVKKTNSKKINSSSHTSKSLSPPSLSVSFKQPSANEKLSVVKQLSVLPTRGAISENPCLDNKNDSKEITPSSHLSKSSPSPASVASTFKKLSGTEKKVAVNKFNSKGLSASPFYTPKSRNSSLSKENNSKDRNSPSYASGSMSPPLVSSSIKKTPVYNKSGSINSIKFNTNFKSINISKLSACMSSEKSSLGKKTNSTDKSSSFIALRSLPPSTVSSKLQKPTLTEKLDFKKKVNSKALNGSPTYTASPGKIWLPIKSDLKRLNGSSSYISVSCSKTKTWLNRGSCSLTRTSVSRSLEKPGSINKINSKEISSFIYPSSSVISPSACSSFVNKENLDITKKNDLVKISDLYSDSWYPLIVPKVSCDSYELQHTTSVDETPNVVLRASQEKLLDQKIFLRTAKRTFTRKIKQTKMKEKKLSQKMMSPNIIEKIGPFYFAAQSELSIPETKSREYEEKSPKSLLQKICSFSEIVSHTLIPMIKTRQSIEIAGSFYGSKMLSHKYNSRKLNQKISSTTPSAFDCVTTLYSELTSRSISLAYSCKGMNIFIIFYAIGFLLISFNQAFVFGKFGWK